MRDGWLGRAIWRIRDQSPIRIRAVPHRAYVWDPSRARGAALALDPPVNLCHVVVAALRRNPRSATYDHAADDRAFQSSVFPLGCWSTANHWCHNCITDGFAKLLKSKSVG